MTAPEAGGSILCLLSEVTASWTSGPVETLGSAENLPHAQPDAALGASGSRPTGSQWGCLTLRDGHSQSAAVALSIWVRATAQRSTWLPHLDQYAVVVRAFRRAVSPHAGFARGNQVSRVSIAVRLDDQPLPESPVEF